MPIRPALAVNNVILELTEKLSLFYVFIQCIFFLEGMIFYQMISRIMKANIVGDMVSVIVLPSLRLVCLLSHDLYGVIVLWVKEPGEEVLVINLEPSSNFIWSAHTFRLPLSLHCTSQLWLELCQLITGQALPSPLYWPPVVSLPTSRLRLFNIPVGLIKAE